MHPSPTLGARVAATAAAAAVAWALGSATAQDAREPEERIEIASLGAQLKSLDQYLQSDTLRVSVLLGMKVEGRSGQVIGKVTDILVRDGAPNRGMAIVVAFGNADDRAATVVTLPLGELQISANGEELYAEQPRARSAAPGLPAAPGGDAPVAIAGAARNRAPTAMPNGSLAPSGVSADRTLAALLGAELIGADGRPVASVEDLVLSTAGIDNLRVVVDVGDGARAGGGKRIALPFERLDISQGLDGGPRVSVAMDLDTLRREPRFDYEQRTAAR